MMRDPGIAMLQPPAPMDLRGKRVLVLGLGDTGLSVVRWVKQRGGSVVGADTRAAPPHAKVLPKEELRTGPFEPALLEGVDLICISPGLSLQEPVVQKAIAAGVPVVGDIELFAWAAPGKVLAITGTNGKSTVTALTAHLLREAGVDAEAAGNIGPPALTALMTRSAKRPAVWVLELSSYQLETTWSLNPAAATLLNLSEDHLDRYKGLVEYGAAKARVFQGRGVQVLNRGDAASMARAIDGRRQVSFGLDAPALAEDFGLAGDWLIRGQQRFFAASDLPLAGAHNVSNALAACALAHAAGVPLAKLGPGLESFRGLPHRMQRVADKGGVAWLDDSKGTNVGATVAALGGLPRPVVLILGGDGKGQDFAPLAPAVKARAKHVLLIGRDAARIRRALAGAGVPLENCDDLEAAVARAAAIARSGDAVLLSPACASFDMFRDYRHRGEVFAAAVGRLP